MTAPTYRTCILARPQKAPSVSLLMLLRCSFSTSRLSSPWNVSPSIRRRRLRFSSLKSPRPYKLVKAQSFLTQSSVQHTMGAAMPAAPVSVVPRRQQNSTGNLQSQTYPGKAAGCDLLNKLTLGQAFTTEKLHSAAIPLHPSSLCISFQPLILLINSHSPSSLKRRHHLNQNIGIISFTIHCFYRTCNCPVKTCSETCRCPKSVGTRGNFMAKSERKAFSSPEKCHLFFPPYYQKLIKSESVSNYNAVLVFVHTIASSLGH